MARRDLQGVHLRCLSPQLRSHREYKKARWASLVAQWLRICLPMQGTRVRALVWEDPTCRGATKPVSHNYWACASETCAPQQERPRQWKVRAPRWRVAPACHSWRKPSHRNEDPTQPKINKLILKKIKKKKFKQKNQKTNNKKKKARLCTPHRQQPTQVTSAPTAQLWTISNIPVGSHFTQHYHNTGNTFRHFQGEGNGCNDEESETESPAAWKNYPYREQKS